MAIDLLSTVLLLSLACPLPRSLGGIGAQGPQGFFGATGPQGRQACPVTVHGLSPPLVIAYSVCHPIPPPDIELELSASSRGLSNPAFLFQLRSF